MANPGTQTHKLVSTLEYFRRVSEIYVESAFAFNCT